MTSSIDAISTQKKIWKQVRAQSSTYSMNLSALNIASERLPHSTNWNQSSDSFIASQQTAYHPSHGNSSKTTLTSIRPGASAPSGKGVDIKHNSYARYLGRKKASNIKTQPTTTILPLHGNKTQSFGLINNSNKCIC
jgi:hypothetical protein